MVKILFAPHCEPLPPTAKLGPRMKTPPPHARRSRTAPKPAPAVTLKVFIGYADLPAVRRATSAVGQAMMRSGLSVDFRPMLWRCEQLVSSHWRDRATSAALEADIVVVASSTPGGITPAVEQWINGFIDAAHGRRATLVVINGANDAWTISIEKPAKRAVVAPLEGQVAAAELVA